MAGPSGGWQDFGRRLLGGANSWRRITAAGVVGGVVLAFAAAMIAAVVNDSGSGSIDRAEPTAVAPIAPVDDAPIEEPPVEEPALETPTPEPLEEPTEVATEAPAEPTPTEEALPTEPVEPPTEVPTAPAGA